VGLLREAISAGAEELPEILALSLSNLGPRLPASGRTEEALVVSREAVLHYRALAGHAAPAFAADVARSLNDLGNRLEDSERHEEALATSRDSLSWILEPSPESPALLRAHDEV